MNAIKPKNTLGLVARILSVPIILFTFLTLGAHLIWPDTEAGSYPPIENLLPLLMALSVAGLVLAWWFEGIGGGMCVLFFIVHLLVYWAIRGKFFPANILVLFTPVLVAGILFIWSGANKRR